MKQQATTQTPKQTMPPQTKGLLPHAAVRATSDHDLFANSPAESRFGHDFSQVAVRQSAPIVSRNYLNVSSPPRIQAKLKIGQPGDKYEQEADRVAEQVMRMPDPGLSSSVGGSSLVNGGNSGGGAGAIQAKTAGITTPEVTPAISSGIQSLQGGGRSLSGAERSFFEPRFGADFSGVRVHDDARAAGVARSVNARAFTLGRDVVFGAGEYSTDGVAGRKLLAHELTHVVQQNPCADQRCLTPLINVVEQGGSTNHRNMTVRKVNEDEPRERAGISISSEGPRLQRDFSVALPNPGAAPNVLSEAEIQEAIDFNRRRFNRDIEIEQIRDVLGISAQPIVIDEDFVNALVRYQAQSNLTQDGKLGPVTSSRLSREFRAEAAFLGREGRELRRESRRLDRRSFTITVTGAANELTNTGSAEYAVQWGVPDPQANGWIIQHVTWRANKVDGAGNAQAVNNSNVLEFWEGWEVRGGNVFIGSGAAAHVADTFRTVDEGAGTRGTATITGRVTFVPGFNLRVPPWGHTIPEAGALPTLAVAPLGWSDGFARLHQMRVTWDDTVAPATHAVNTTP